jgi:hypothetical protein
MMRSKNALTWIVVGFFGLSVFALVQEPRAIAQDRKGASPKWEYCEFRLKSTGGIRWEGHNDQVQSTATFQELGKNLGMPVKSNMSTAFLNVLGSDGWELVSHGMIVRADRSTEEVWTLKRNKN